MSELVTLKTWNVGMNEGVLRVVGKGGKERLVPFGQVAQQWLNPICAMRAPPSWAGSKRMTCS